MSRLLHIDRWILDPLYAITTLFWFQALAWWLWMPDLPTIEKAAPRFETSVGMWRFAALFTCLLLGLLLGRMIAATLVKPIDNSRFVPSATSVRRFVRIAIWALLLAAVGELVYTRTLNVAMVKQALLNGGSIADVGEAVRSERVTGLSSLNNLFLVPAAVFSLLAFHPGLAPDERRKHRRWLIVLGLVALVHALLLAARVFFALYLAIVVAAFLLLQARSGGRVGRVIWLAIFAGLALIWVGETSRSGLRYANQNVVSPLSLEAQQYVRDVLVQGYLAADFNNAMVILSNEPAEQYVSTSPVFMSLAGLLGVREVAGYGDLPNWWSAYGTVNVLALWWYDFGWLAAGVAVLVGGWLGATYIMARRTASSLSISSLLYLISFPAVFFLVRVNYFGLTMFVAPFLYISFVAMLRLIAAIRSPALRLDGVEQISAPHD